MPPHNVGGRHRIPEAGGPAERRARAPRTHSRTQRPQHSVRCVLDIRISRMRANGARGQKDAGRSASLMSM
eukprot:9155602-Alexandrium_andersonii.AAC.1